MTLRTINNTLTAEQIADLRFKYRFDPEVQRLCEALEVAQQAVADLRRTSLDVCERLEVNELVTSSSNSYDQTAYDAAMEAIKQYE